MTGEDFKEGIRREAHRKLIDGSAVIHTPGEGDWRLSEVPSGNWVAWEESATVRDFVQAALAAGYVVTPVDSTQELGPSVEREQWPELDEPGSPGPLPVKLPAQSAGYVALDTICGRDGAAYYIRWAVNKETAPPDRQ